MCCNTDGSFLFIDSLNSQFILVFYSSLLLAVVKILNTMVVVDLKLFCLAVKKVHTYICRFSVIILRAKRPMDCIFLCLHVRNKQRNSPTYWGPRFCHLRNRKQNTDNRRQLSYSFLALELRIIALLNVTAVGLLSCFLRQTSGNKCLLTVLALLLSDDLDLSKSG